LLGGAFPKKQLGKRYEYNEKNAKFGVKKSETSFYGGMQSIFRNLATFRQDSRM